MFERLKVAKRLDKLEEDHATLRSEWKRMRLEWEDTFDKLQSVIQRIAKRAQRIEQLQAQDQGETNEDKIPNSPVENPGPGLKLSARQMEAQQKILARRARLPQ